MTSATKTSLYSQLVNKGLLALTTCLENPFILKRYLITSHINVACFSSHGTALSIYFTHQQVRNLCLQTKQSKYGCSGASAGGLCTLHNNYILIGATNIRTVSFTVRPRWLPFCFCLFTKIIT